MPRRARYPKAVTRPPFDPLHPFNPGFDSPAEEADYWREYRDEWMQYHITRRPGTMPEPFWRYEVGDLVEDTGPIDWHDYTDERTQRQVALGQVDVMTCVDLAHAQRLADRRAEWLAEHPDRAR